VGYVGSVVVEVQAIRPSRRIDAEASRVDQPPRSLTVRRRAECMAFLVPGSMRGGERGIAE